MTTTDPTPDELHLKAVDEVNDAHTEAAHRAAWDRLHAIRDTAKAAGRPVSLTSADWHTGARYGFPDLDEGCPPVCCGVRLDWSVDGYPTHAAIVPDDAPEAVVAVDPGAP
jgi:hypothetical protein